MTNIYLLRRIADKSIFYIGRSNHPMRRFAQHKCNYTTSKDKMSQYIKECDGQIEMIVICKANNDTCGALLEMYFIDLAFVIFPALFNKYSRFTKSVSKELSFTVFCIKYGIKQVELLDFSIFYK